MMIFTPSFRKTIGFSLFGHLSLFFIFSFSFAPKTIQGEPPALYFLQKVPFVQAGAGSYSVGIRHFFVAKRASFALSKTQESALEIGPVYLKPEVESLFWAAKAEYKGAPLQLNPVLNKAPTAIIFHPQIPYSLAPYFKNREAVHIELMFNTVQMKEGSSVQVRRKVSSGSLEADLLSMRYISRYLSMQRQELPVNAWQTVKIDLSAK